MGIQFIFSLSATETLFFVLVYFTLIIWAFAKVIQKERGWSLVGWGLFLWFVPFLGALVYFIKYFSDKGKVKAVS